MQPPGSRAACSMSAPPSALPLSSITISDRRYVYVADQATDSVAVIDAQTNAIKSRVGFPWATIPVAFGKFTAAEPTLHQCLVQKPAGTFGYVNTPSGGQLIPPDILLSVDDAGRLVNDGSGTKPLCMTLHACDQIVPVGFLVCHIFLEHSACQSRSNPGVAHYNDGMMRKKVCDVNGAEPRPALCQ